MPFSLQHRPNGWILTLTQTSSPETHAFLPATFALRRTPRVPGTLLGKAGYYMMDLSACIVEATYTAALASVNCALSAADSVFRTRRLSFALCPARTPSAGKDYAAGYCLLNNASVAANWLSSQGKVALLTDIDYHAGNGTQDIYYERNDVLTISIHGDPDYEYPFITSASRMKLARHGLDSIEISLSRHRGYAILISAR